MYFIVMECSDNCHSMRDHDAVGFNAFVKNYTSDRETFTRAFLANIFGDGKMPAGTEWMIEESLIVPTHIGIALYSDYVYSEIKRCPFDHRRHIRRIMPF